MAQKMGVCNHQEYNKMLKERGCIFSIFRKAYGVWFYTEPQEGKWGKAYRYSHELIILMHTVGYLFHLPLRQLQGAFEDFLTQTFPEDKRSTPHYATLSRRLRQLDIPLQDHRQKDHQGPMEICIDSSGINIYNTGGGHSKENAKTRQHKGYAQVRKMHIILDPDNLDVLALTMTAGTVMDDTVGASLIEGCTDTIETCYADRAYDRVSCRRACAKKHIRQVIPPTRRAKLRQASPSDPPHLFEDRNSALRFIRAYPTYDEGFTAWKQAVGYGKRAHVEGFFSRFKRTFGFSFRTKNEQNRQNELRLKAKILNDFTAQGKVLYKKVA